MHEESEAEDRIVRSLVAEAVGTFMLTFVDAGGKVIGAVSCHAVSENADT